MAVDNNSYFWSYDQKDIPVDIRIEHILKFGDIKEIQRLIQDFGRDNCHKIWKDKIISDSRFNRLNYFLARFIFDISDNPKEIQNFLIANQRTRFENRN
jgi:hypothetical protein